MTKELTSKGVRRRSITRYPAIYGKDLGKVDLRQNDRTNAAGTVPLTKVQIKAETDHHVRLQPETQEKAAAKRSVRGPMGRGRRR